MRIVVAVVCVLVIGSVLLEAFEGLVLPRRISRPLRVVRLFYLSLWLAWRRVGRRLGPGLRDDWFAVFGPFSVLALFVAWGMLLVAAFAGLGWSLQLPISAPEATPTLATYFYLSATTFITLGFGDVAPKTTFGRAVVDTEAALGFGFLAIVIAYLPVLYQAFAKREVEIGMLDARASTPPSAGELLLRIGVCPELADLKDTLKSWERWSAELLESHLSYPSLMYWRSQHDKQSWLGTLTAILDTCALLIATQPKGALFYQARLTFAMARHAAVDLRLALGITPFDPQRLPPTEQEALFALLAEAGFPLDASPEAHALLVELRALYEPHLAALATWLELSLPTIAPNPNAHDHWKMSTDPAGHFFNS